MKCLICGCSEDVCGCLAAKLPGFKPLTVGEAMERYAKVDELMKVPIRADRHNGVCALCEEPAGVDDVTCKRCGAEFTPWDPSGAVVMPPPPSGVQVGGEHYKAMAIQPAEFCQRNRVPWCEANVIKYVCRHRVKNGRQDIEKAIHYLNLLLEWEYEK